MKINAAILWEQGKPLSVEETELDAPQAGEVLVEVKSATLGMTWNEVSDECPIATKVVY